MLRLLASLTIILSASAQAAPANPESIDKLFSVMKVESSMDAMYGAAEQMMRQTMQQMTQGKTLTAEQQRVLDTLPARYAKVIREELGWDKMKPLIVQVYRETFEQDEIDGLLAFYSSPAGTAFVNKTPIAMQRTMALMQTTMQTLIPKMTAAVDAAMAEAQAPK